MRSINKSKLQSGFTLIELLIVVAIIGILSSLLLSNLIGVRQRARDAQRKSDVRQIQSALELYRADTGAYPTTLPSCTQALTSEDGTVSYMSKIPCDPLYDSSQATNNFQYYYYHDDTGAYCLRACLENLNDGQKDVPNNLPADTKCLFTSLSPQGVCDTKVIPYKIHKNGKRFQCYRNYSCSYCGDDCINNRYCIFGKLRKKTSCECRSAGCCHRTSCCESPLGIAGKAMSCQYYS
ncbi:MAG: prepilin-type N-terminal cleavage/methylation domain-containing protein [Candidatus Levybacteria bacterium]|nr:prepilin-type N-terminal cleavage/methylation domain-containing protein [Candidatus Levybacteria bacterium]